MKLVILSHRRSEKYYPLQSSCYNHTRSGNCATCPESNTEKYSQIHYGPPITITQGAGPIGSTLYFPSPHPLPWYNSKSRHTTSMSSPLHCTPLCVHLVHSQLYHLSGPLVPPRVLASKTVHEQVPYLELIGSRKLPSIKRLCSKSQVNPFTCFFPNL